MNENVKRRIDFRVLVGIGIVVASSAVGALLFSGATATLPVYVAATTISPGQKISEGDVRVSDVQIGEASAQYLQIGSFPKDAVAQTTIRAGELIPVNSLSSKVNLKNTRVVVPVISEISSEVAPGSLVEIWSSFETDQGFFSTPEVIVPQAEVVKVNKQSGLALSSGPQSVELIVPRDKIASVLEAQANSDVISILPVGASS